jgi:hypothetical protein
MMSAEDMRPEGNLLIGLSYFALQRQTRILHQLMRHGLRWHSFGWSPINPLTQAN